MKNLLLKVLYFSKKERRSALLLLFLSFGLMLGPDAIKSQFKNTMDPRPLQDWEKDLIAHIDQAETLVTEEDSLELVPFDPNTTNKEDLLDMNIPPKVVYTIINYREKGGRFRKKEDLQKIYGLDSNLYLQLEPYVQIKGNVQTRNPQKRIVTKFLPDASKNKKIDVNQAKREDWESFYGIGPVLSARIVKFREALGGFSNIEQVGETYGLKDSTFQQIKPSLSLEIKVQQININQASKETLAGHPYISWKLAKLIIAFRSQHGPFKDLQDLKKMKELPKDFFEKIGPYLSVDDS